MVVLKAMTQHNWRENITQTQNLFHCKTSGYLTIHLQKSICKLLMANDIVCWEQR